MTESKRVKREWNPNFIEYMKFIVAHPNYKDMPNKFKENGEISWVMPSDKKRAAWWDKKIQEMNLTSRADVARAIHPKELKGLKPCQVCGKELSVHYIYPNKNTLKKLNSLSNTLTFSLYNEDIYEIYDELEHQYYEKTPVVIKKVFDITTVTITDKIELIDFIIKNCTSRLSPGAMSNPPDRLDGFHTYNACCRGKEDTGRHSSNLKRYTQDRRAYENWAEGDFNLSNRLMGEFQRYNTKIMCPECKKTEQASADHIGPISLGFTHRPMFNPLCQSCNSTKNNRMTLADVKLLVQHEKDGLTVVSWHSTYIWNYAKNKIKTTEDALTLSKAMRLHLHNTLTLFAIIASKGHENFLLRFLHPEYSFFDYKFESFDPLDLTKLKIIKKPLDSKNKQKNADRYLRISFESLHEYQKKENRNVKEFNDPTTQKMITELMSLLNKKEYAAGENKIKIILQKLSEQTIAMFSI